MLYLQATINLTSGFNRESVDHSDKAGILTCNGVYHPSRFWQRILVDKILCVVTYSCATVRDLHTIP